MGGNDHILQTPELAFRRKGFLFKDIEHCLDLFSLKNLLKGLLINRLSPSNTIKDRTFLHQGEFLFSQNVVGFWRKGKGVDEIIHQWDHLIEIVLSETLIYILHWFRNSF